MSRKTGVQCGESAEASNTRDRAKCGYWEYEYNYVAETEGM